MGALATFDRTRVFGLTHDAAGAPQTRMVRMLKVSIGFPMGGPAIHVWIDQQGQWCVQTGSGKEPQVRRLTSRKEAETYYREQRRTTPKREYPGKLPYFTFLRTGPDGQYWHDFDAIEQHGATPTEIDIVFLSDRPLDQAFQWWTAAALQCEGNGIDARRRVEHAKATDEKALAAQARSQGESFFPILQGCYTKDCPYPRGDKPVCKPHSRLSFQLVGSPMIGGTCTYDTTGWRSGANLFSCIEQIKTITGRGDANRGVIAGIPLRLILRPYKTSHKGQPSTQYGVSLLFRAADALELHKKLIAAGDEFRAVTQTPLLIESGPMPDEAPAAVVHEGETVEAGRMAAEFYTNSPDGVQEAEWDDYPDTLPPVQTQKAELPRPRRKSEQAKPSEPAPLTEAEMNAALAADLAREAEQDRQRSLLDEKQRGKRG